MTSIPFSDACERNKSSILEILKQVLPVSGRILEIGSCTGQHLVFFAPEFPGLQWQGSDRAEYRQGLRARIERQGGENILEPIELDVLGRWPEPVFDAVYSANTAHIMSWNAVCAMFAGVEFHLAPGGPFCLYGPFNRQGRFTAESNRNFDHQLRAQSAEMGLRDLDALESLARCHQMTLVKTYPMPANNQLLVFTRIKEPANE
jgi:cyclopropane fatty-acyl-phospholipid synthase-like methyltransferase